MTKLLPTFVAAVLLAGCSDQYSRSKIAKQTRYVIFQDVALLALIILLGFFAGLRTDYNDTWNYIAGFKESLTFSKYLNSLEEFDVFGNPLFYIFRSALRSISADERILLLSSSLFVQTCFILFLKRYSTHFTFSVFLYFTLGTFTFSIAAIKQTMAMAIFTLAFPFLLKKKWILYYLLIAVAMMFHTYAIAFAVLPLFMQKPWKPFTYLFIFSAMAVLLTFEGTITAFLDAADEAGKSISSDEVFHGHTVNIFRVAVYAVVPLISWLFRKWIFAESTETDHVLVHMSILSFAFMALGTKGGANMFARMATYFELGTLCCLPKMLKSTFEPRTLRAILVVASACFFLYFAYENLIRAPFDTLFSSITIWELFFGN